MASKITLYDESGAPQYLDGEALKTLLRPQTWQNVIASRSKDVLYTNTTGKPIYIVISCSDTTARELLVDGVFTGSIPTLTNKFTVQAIVPNESTYIFNGNPTEWSELR